MPQKFWNFAIVAIGLLSFFLFVISVKELKSINYVGKSDQVTNSITVEGSGDTVTIPDIATFSFTVTKTANTVAEAQKQASDQSNAALKAIRSGGVVDKDIKTISYNINPHYEYQNGICSSVNNCKPGKSVLTGYDVSQSTQVKVRDLSKAGVLFASIGDLGVQNVDGLTFSVDKPESLQAEARSIAIVNAQAKAKTLASQLGVSLVRIISFSENNNSPGPVMYAMNKAMASSESSAPQISAGEQKVSSSVSITYEII